MKLISRKINFRIKKLLKIQNKQIDKYIKSGFIGSLDLTFYQSPNLPEELTTVNGDLHLNYSKIERLPTKLKSITGGLYMRFSRLEELQDNLFVGGPLYIDFTKIRKLPNNLFVGGSLDIDGTKIEDLPENINIYGNFWCQLTPLSSIYSKSQIRSYFNQFNGNIYV